MGTLFNYIWKTTLAAVLTASIVVWPAIASVVTQANDFPTSLVTSATANHEVIFTTPTGVSEGSTITITFDSSFDTSSLVEDDIDVMDDAVDLTTASDCSGGEEASVTIANDVVTITICAGDGGAIAATSIVTVEIGSNATTFGVGSNQITNPANVGTYFVALGGTFGDFGSIALPITEEGAVSVSGTVQSGSSGAGQADTKSPSIALIVVYDITSYSAFVSWHTNELANSRLDYGLTAAFELGTVTSGGMVLVHGLELSGLDSGTTYYFRARSADTSGNTGTSPTKTFQTLDVVAPVISKISAVDVTTSSAAIEWDTDEDSDSVVEWGLTVNYGSSVSDDELLKDHRLVINGLLDGTGYHFRVKSKDASGNEAVSDDLTFVSDTDEPPANVSNLVVTPGDGQNVLTWSNPNENDLLTIHVLMCLDEAPDSQTDEDCEVVLNALVETFTHLELVNGTTYYYGVFSKDAAGQFASGALGSGAPNAPEEEQPIVPGEVPEEGDDNGDLPEEGGPGDLPGQPVGPQEGQPGGGDPIEPVTPSSPLGAGVSGDLSLEDVSFIAANTIRLLPNGFGTIDALGLEPLRIWVSASELKADVKTVTVSIGEQLFLMRLEEDANTYAADVLTPFVEQPYVVSLTVLYKDGSEETVSSLLRVVKRGRALQDIDGEEANLPGVTIRLLQHVGDNLVAWDGSPYDQNNPQTTEVNGTFGYYVPNGRYTLQATAQGYRPYDGTSFTVTNHIVNVTFFLTAYPLDGEELVEEEAAVLLGEPKGVVETTTALVQNVLETPVLETVSKALEAVREVEAVQTAARIATPTLVVTAGVSVVVLAVAFDFLPFLQYFFTAPILFFWRRKRKGYGTVYNAYTKTPVDLAVIRLYAMDPQKKNSLGRLVKSRVTDRAGRFFFLVKPGEYRIVVSKRSFVYPSQVLSGKKEDGDFVDLYHGEVIRVNAVDAVITPNIPMDPKDSSITQTPKRVVWKRRIRVIQNVVALIGMLAAVAFAIVRPTVLAVSMIAVQVVIYALARRLAKPHKPKSWGIVYDKQTNRPLANVVARIFEPTYNKLLDTQVTDSKGRYAFLLGTGKFYAVFEKKGYRSTKVTPIDIEAQKGSEDFSVDVELHRGEQTPTKQIESK